MTIRVDMGEPPSSSSHADFPYRTPRTLDCLATFGHVHFCMDGVSSSRSKTLETPTGMHRAEHFQDGIV
jgi:hypothetical protein